MVNAHPQPSPPPTLAPTIKPIYANPSQYPISTPPPSMPSQRHHHTHLHLTSLSSTRHSLPSQLTALSQTHTSRTARRRIKVLVLQTERRKSGGIRIISKGREEGEREKDDDNDDGRASAAVAAIPIAPHAAVQTRKSSDTKV